MIHSHARCDYEPCGSCLFPTGAEMVDDGYLAEMGWVSVRWTEGEEEPVDEVREFCSFGCVSKWAALEVEEPASRSAGETDG